MTLVNLDQALKLILDETCLDLAATSHVGAVTVSRTVVLEAMRRAYRLAESKEEMMKMIVEPAVPALKEEVRGNND